jgi:septal ring factor EnvC (AmiA/AmiB activator)
MKRLTIIILTLFVFFSAQAQPTDKARLENERKALQKELKEIQSVYSKVKGQKKETIGQLNLLQKKMAVQGKYVGNINKEIKLISNDIYTNTLQIKKLQRQLDTLKAQYARSVVYAYKTRSNYDYLNFIFSANTFNDALKRIAYLKTYRSYRQDQVENIVETQKSIKDHKDQLLGKKTQKNSALQNQTQQLKELEEQKKEKDVVVSKLKSKESELSKQISVRKKKDAQLKNSISAIIRREIEARRKAEEAERLRRIKEEDALVKENTSSGASTAKTRATSKKVAVPLNAKEVALSSSFSSNRGKLPWPVDNGYVSIPYGTYSIPGTSIKGDNPGLTITTPSPGTTVKSVFDGEVLSVFNLGDGTMAVTISHGKYFTTYSNLSGITVSKGSNVRTGQAIGRAAADDEGGGGGKLDFILMVEVKNVNPSPWLRRS